MEVEVVAAGGAADELRSDGHSGRQQDDGGTDEAVRFGRQAVRSHKALLYEYPTLVRSSCSF